MYLKPEQLLYFVQVFPITYNFLAFKYLVFSEDQGLFLMHIQLGAKQLLLWFLPN